MDQLVAQVAERIGVEPDKARAAVDTVLNFLKQRLPGPIAGQIDQAVDSAETTGPADVSKRLGGMFGS